MTPSDPREANPTATRSFSGRERCRECGFAGGRSGPAVRMAEPGRADARHLPGLRRDVEDDVVRMRGIAGHSTRHEIELERAARAPRDVVVRARGVAAHADAADQCSL